MTIILPSDRYDYNGILHRSRGINVKCKSKTSVSTGTDNPSLFTCKYATENTKEMYYCSERNDFNQWIEFEFPKYVVAITNYSISATSQIKNAILYGPNSYIFEAFDGTKWHLLDKVDKTDLNKRGITMTRPVEMVGIFYKFRLTQTGLNTGNEKEFRICKFDIFGSIHRKHPLTCKQKRERKCNFAFL